MTAVDLVLERLSGVKRSGSGFVAKCPAHEDRRQSLSVSEGDDGRVLLHCHAGCDPAAVCAAVSLTPADLFERNGDGKRQVVAEYDYTDEAGKQLFQVVRLSPKDFRQRRPDGAGDWTWRLGDVRRVLYRLPKVLEAARASGTVYVVEGEKDVEAIERAGAVATCNAGGAGKWRGEYSECLRGAHVVIVADKDEPGRKHAATVATSLAGVAASVVTVEAASGKDAADHLARGHRLDEFLTVAPEALSSIPDGCTATVQPAIDVPLVQEAAHTEVLAGAWHDEYRWDQHRGTWRRWSGCVWEAVASETVAARAQQLLARHYALTLAAAGTESERKRLRHLHGLACRLSSVRAGLEFLKGRPGFHIPFDEWDKETYLLNCADGLLDVKTMTLREHDPAALCTRITAWPYAPSETTGAWRRQLERCLPDPDVRRQVQRDLGRALVDAVLEESLPIWYGSGANGKSTIQRAIMAGLGGYARAAARGLLLTTRHEGHPTGVADLAGARLVFSEEVDQHERLAESLVKELTGGGRKKARFMHRDFFEFEQTFSIFMLVNHRPRISGVDTGIWRRIRLVPWTVAILRDEQRDQDAVVAELMADGPWMLQWMVAGFADWQANPHWIADAVLAATEAYRVEEDRLAGFFAECTEQAPHDSVAKDALFTAYGAWAEREKERRPLSKTMFGKAMKERGFDEATEGHAKTRVWLGIGLIAGES